MTAIVTIPAMTCMSIICGDACEGIIAPDPPIDGIDAIAEQMPYKRYEAADTALRMQAGNLGERSAMFRDPPGVRAAVEDLRRAQAEATLRCFQ